MSTRLSREQTYDAPLSDVTAMLLDPAFREEVLRAQHSTRQSVAVTETATGTQVRLESSQAVAGIPSFATKFVGDSIDLIQSETWRDGGTRAQVTIEIPGKPGSIKGEVSLTEAGGVTTERIDLDVTAKVPLIGGKLESLVGDLVLKALAQEERVGQRWLAR